MPPKENTVYTIGFTDEDGFHPLGKPIEECTLENDNCDVRCEKIETSELPDTQMFREGGFVEFKPKNPQLIEKIFKSESHGARVLCETSCICDGTLFFAVQLAQVLKEIGCVCINVRSETVENADPSWMNCRFIDSGIMWNTNNWRKMHGLPMKRRIRNV